jgi:hypothetical protein
MMSCLGAKSFPMGAANILGYLRVGSNCRLGVTFGSRLKPYPSLQARLLIRIAHIDTI